MKSRLNFKHSICIFGLFSLVVSCIPLRKQYYVIDSRKPTISAIQKTDTTIYFSPYEYKIRNGDNIVISVSNLQFDAAGGINEILKSKNQATNNSPSASTNPQNVEGYIVNDSGYVNLPFLGSVEMKGLTLEEAESKINKLASKYFNHTITNVRIGFNYTVVMLNNGILRSSLNPKLTLLEVISQSSIPDYGNLQKIKIIRKNNENSGVHIYYVDINDQSIVSKPEFYIYPNDIIIIEAYRLKNFNQYFVRNIGLVSTFAGLPFLIFSFINTLRR